MSTHAAAARFLADFFGAPRTAAVVCVESLANEKSAGRRIRPKRIQTRKPDRIIRFCDEWDVNERATYFCVATVQPGKRRNKENLAELVCLHADLDFKSIEATPAQIRRVVAQLPLLPSRVVFSGHGLHAYWIFPVGLPATHENIERIEGALRRLSDVLAGDPSVCQAAQLMRMPSTHNSKGGDWIKVTVRDERPNTYTLKVLETWLATATPLLHCVPTDDVPDDPWTALASAQMVRAPIDVEERLAAMRHHGPGGTAIHPTQLSVTAALLRRGMSIENVVAKVLAATQAAVGAEGANWDRRPMACELHAMCNGWLAKHPEIAVYETEMPATASMGR